MKELNEIVKELKPSVLIGAAAVPKVSIVSREGGDWSPKFYNNVFLLVSLTTLATFIEFKWLVY